MKAEAGEDPGLIGRILYERGVITRRELVEAVSMALASDTLRIGDAIVERGFASREDVEAAYQKQRLLKAKTRNDKNATAHNVIDLGKTVTVRAANSIASAYDRAVAIERRFRRRRKTGGG